MKVVVERFHLNGHSIGFRPQTQKLEPLQNSFIIIIHPGIERVNLESMSLIPYYKITEIVRMI